MIKPRFYQPYKPALEFYLILFGLLICIVIVHLFELDFYFADLIYQANDAWTYRHSWLASVLIHKYAKYVLVLMYLMMLSYALMLLLQNKNSRHLYDHFTLLTTLLLGTGMVSLMQNLFAVDCPWNLVQYGGDKPYSPMFAYDPALLPSARCFPSGHSSAGFTWVSLYFYCCVHFEKYKFVALGFALATGTVFSISQQYRGAHFISHDIWSLVICLSINALAYSFAYQFNIQRKPLTHDKKK